MSNGARVGILLILAIAIGAVVIARRPPVSGSSGGSSCCPAISAMLPVTTSPASQPAATMLPRLVDLGAGKCIPCKKMAPILEEMKAEFVGRLQVDFIDVWINPTAGEQYGIRMIPTQIFYDASGKELSRHEGFMPRADILARFKEHGMDLSGGSSPMP